MHMARSWLREKENVYVFGSFLKDKTKMTSIDEIHRKVKPYLSENDLKKIAKGDKQLINKLNRIIKGEFL